jgi:hypothetical protein
MPVHDDDQAIVAALRSQMPPAVRYDALMIAVANWFKTHALEVQREVLAGAGAGRDVSEHNLDEYLQRLLLTLMGRLRRQVFGEAEPSPFSGETKFAEWVLATCAGMPGQIAGDETRDLSSLVCDRLAPTLLPI